MTDKSILERGESPRSGENENEAAVLAERFHQLFAGLDRAYGTYILNGEVRDDGKREGDAVTKKAHVTAALWEKHLSGKQGLGIVPIRDDGTAVFGAIDIDCYADLSLVELVRQAASFRLPLVVCRSKSGGGHLYLFSADPVPAKSMQSRLGEIAALLGHSKAEIFPKQSRLDADKEQTGSWINMPYQNGLMGMRYAIRDDGDAMTPAEFLEFAERSKAPKAFFSKPLNIGDDFADGPPCLQHLASIGFPLGTRNNGLFNIAVYSRKVHGENGSWENPVHAMNAKFMQPEMVNSEVQGVIKSAGRKDYGYLCEQPPIAQHCNRALCRVRKYGIGTMSGALPVMGQLTKYDTKPPVWEWEIEGVQVTLTTDELMEFNKFSKKYAESANRALPNIRTDVWRVSFVQPALDNLHVESMPEESSPEGMLWEMLERFCTGRRQANCQDEITVGKPWTDAGWTWFRLHDFRSFLEQHRFRALSDQEISAAIKKRNSKHDFWKIRGKGVNVWGVPEFDHALDDSLPVPDLGFPQQPVF